MNKSIRDADDDRLGATPAPMSLQPVANMCTAGACPTVYLSGSGTLVVQGYAVPAELAGVDLPDGATLVEIPLDLFNEAIRNLS